MRTEDWFRPTYRYDSIDEMEVDEAKYVIEAEGEPWMRARRSWM